MSSEKPKIWTEWKKSVNFRNQSLAGKLILIFSVLLLGTIITINFLTLALGRWRPLGFYSIWVLFGWLFLIILVYITVKLGSMLVQKNRTEKQELSEQKDKQSVL